MPGYTLASLKTEIENLMEDDFSDFVRDLDGIIDRAETRIYLDLGLELSDYEVKADITDADNGEFSIPIDHVSLSHVVLNSNSCGCRTLSLRPSGYMRMALENRTQAEDIRYYGPREQDGAMGVNVAPKPVYRVGPLPSVGVRGTINVVVHRKPETLLDATDGTYISLNMPSLLLAASLVEAERRNKNAEAQAAREQEYQLLVIEWSGLSNPQRKRDGSNAQRGVGQ